MPQDNFDFLDETGSSDFEPAKYDDIFQKKFSEFITNVTKNARSKGLISTGEMISGDSFSFKIVEISPQVTEIQLFAKYYSWFVDKGVKGWGSSKNAPNSPYKFKTKGMDEKGRESIMNYIKNSREILTNVKSKRVGLETKTKKQKSKLEMATDRAIWNIKKYGIKETNFYTDAFYDTFKDFGKELNDGVKKNIIVKIVEI